MRRENNIARRWFGLPGLAMLIAAITMLNSCGYENVNPDANRPAVVEDDPDPDPKPPKDGHGGRLNGETGTRPAKADK